MDTNIQRDTNVQTAMDMLLMSDATVDQAADWLMRQEPDHFATHADAVVAITG